MLEKTLESPLNCKKIQPVHPKGNQSWMFIGRTDVEGETSIFWHLMQRADSFEIILTLRKIECMRSRGQQRMGWLDGISDSMEMSLGTLSRSWWWTRRPGVLQSMGSQRVRHDWVIELKWTELNLWVYTAHFQPMLYTYRRVGVYNFFLLEHLKYTVKSILVFLYRRISIIYMEL